MVKANVYDISKLTESDINIDESFAVDTNVLFWMHYSRASYGAREYQLTEYPRLISMLSDLDVECLTTVYNISELLHIIERTEFTIYKDTNNRSLGIKKFRNIIEERMKVKDELSSVYMQLEDFYRFVTFPLDSGVSNEFISQLLEHTCDNFDFSILTYLDEMNIKNVITDDIDFITYKKGINVFTANKTAIRLAKEHNLLMT